MVIILLIITMKKSKATRLNGKAKIFYNGIKKLSQEQFDDGIMLSEWEESVGFNLFHISGSDIELPRCLCGTKVKISKKRYTTDDRNIHQNKIEDLYKILDQETDNDKRVLIDEKIHDEGRKMNDNENYIHKQKLNLTVFINRKTFKTVFIGSTCKTKFDSMMFDISNISTNCKNKSVPLIKELEEKYKITATTPEIYVFQLFTLHYNSLSNHFEELKVDKRNYECRYKDLKHIETQIVEFLEQYGDTVVKIEQMDIHKNGINLMRNMKGKWEEYLSDLQTYIKFIEESKIQEEKYLKKMERERIINKIINDKIEKYRKYQSKMNEKSKILLYIKKGVISELNKQQLLLINKLTIHPTPRIYNVTMKNLHYNTYLEIPFKNKDIFKSEFSGKYDIVNKLWYISNYLYTRQRKDYILKYIGYEVIWRLDVDSNLQTNNNTQPNNIMFDKENIKLREYQRGVEEERQKQLLKQEQRQRELSEQRQMELLEQEQRQKIEEQKLEESLNEIIKGRIIRTLREEEIKLKKLKDKILHELKIIVYKKENKNLEEEMKTCGCGIKLWSLCRCDNSTKSKPIKTKRKTDNLRVCCSCNKYKCKCK